MQENNSFPERLQQLNDIYIYCNKKSFVKAFKECQTNTSSVYNLIQGSNFNSKTC